MSQSTKIWCLFFYSYNYWRCSFSLEATKTTYKHTWNCEGNNKSVKKKINSGFLLNLLKIASLSFKSYLRLLNLFFPPPLSYWRPVLFCKSLQNSLQKRPIFWLVVSLLNKTRDHPVIFPPKGIKKSSKVTNLFGDCSFQYILVIVWTLLVFFSSAHHPHHLCCFAKQDGVMQWVARPFSSIRGWMILD